MRMGYMVLPDALLDKFTSAFSSGANVVPLFEQKTLAAMLRGGYFERHIQRLRSYYRNLRAEVIRALKKLSPDCRIIDTGSGLHMLARFPSAKNDDEIKRFAAAAGVNVRCLSDYLLAPMDGVEKYAVINYSGVTAAQLAETGANK